MTRQMLQMQMRWSVTVLLMCGVVVLEPAHAQQVTPAAPESIEARVDQIFERWDRFDSPGCAVAVARKGRTVYARGFGMANLAYGIPITPSTRFFTGSLSKHITAAAVILAAQRGHLSLDDDVRRLVPEVPDFGEPITLRHLLDHRSGLREQWSLLEYTAWRTWRDVVTEDDLLAHVSRQRELKFRPGTEYAYSNMGYTLLAVALERATGQSLREFTSAHLFQPLGMTATFFLDDHAEVVERLATGYVTGADGRFRLLNPNFDAVGPNGLVTTVEDLMRWDRNFYEPRVGGRALMDQLHREGSYRGLRRHQGMGGGEGAFGALFWRFPDQRFSVALLCNARMPNRAEPAERIVDLYLADDLGERPPEGPPRRPAVSERSPFQMDDSVLQSYAGLYVADEIDFLYRFEVDDEGLVLRRLKAAPTHLRPEAPDSFSGGPRGSRIVFLRGAEGAVVGFVLAGSSPGEMVRFTKVTVP